MPFGSFENSARSVLTERQSIADWQHVSSLGIELTCPVQNLGQFYAFRLS